MTLITEKASGLTLSRRCSHCGEEFISPSISARRTCSEDCALASARATRAAIAAGLISPRKRTVPNPIGRTVAIQQKEARAAMVERAIARAHYQRQIDEIRERLQYYERRLPQKAAELRSELTKLKTLLEKNQESENDFE